MKRQLVLISGGTRGLGAAVARHCLDAGYCVATFSRGSSDFVESQEASDPKGEQFYWESVDATNTPALKGYVSRVVQHFGGAGVDVLINNAGTGRFGLFSTAPLKDIDDSLRTNIAGAMLLTRLCSPQMVARRGGCIVNISSVNAIRGHAGVAIYSATKAALDGFTRALARELGPRDVRVNSVAPGYFESDMTAKLSDRQRDKLIRGTPLGRLGTANDIAGAVMFLISDQAAFITGQTLIVDGGVTC